MIRVWVCHHAVVVVPHCPYALWGGPVINVEQDMVAMTETEFSPNEIDEIMNRDPEGLSDQDLDKVIAIHRKWRADFAAGIKPKKVQAMKQELPIANLIQSITRNTEEPKPVIPQGGGLRR